MFVQFDAPIKEEDLQEDLEEDQSWSEPDDFFDLFGGSNPLKEIIKEAGLHIMDDAKDEHATKDTQESEKRWTDVSGDLHR